MRWIVTKLLVDSDERVATIVECDDLRGLAMGTLEFIEQDIAVLLSIVRHPKQQEGLTP